MFVTTSCYFQFFVGVLSSIALKLTSSIDDVVWLVPFLICEIVDSACFSFCHSSFLCAAKSRSKILVNAAIYTGVCIFQAIIALTVSTGGIAALDAIKSNDAGWCAEQEVELKPCLISCAAPGRQKKL